MTAKPLALLCTIVTIFVGASPAAAQLPADRTVMVVTYERGRVLQPAGAFNGVLIDASHVLTSDAALRQPCPLVGKMSPDLPDEVMVVIRIGDQQILTVASIEPHEASPDIAVLTLDQSGIEITRPVVTKRAGLARLPKDGECQAIGTMAPAGVTPDQFPSVVIPAPAALNVTLRGVDGPTAGIEEPLPLTFAGAGVWTQGGQLVGILTRLGHEWRIAPVMPREKPAKPAGPTIADSPPEKMTPESPVATTNGKGRGGVSLELRGLMLMMRDMDLKPRIEPGLLDYARQDQADMVMCYIASGRNDEALKLLDDIQPLASGHLADQLNYRRALALVLAGRGSEASAYAIKAQASSDPLVKARAKVLGRTLDTNHEDTFGGKPLTDSAVLAAAIQAELDKVDTEARTALKALAAQRPTTEAAITAAIEKLAAIRQSVEEYKDAWPGYLDELIGQLETIHNALMQPRSR
jgi:hypothetical protein